MKIHTQRENLQFRNSDALNSPLWVVTALVLSLEERSYSSHWPVAFQFALNNWGTQGYFVPEAILYGETFLCSPKKILYFQPLKTRAFSSTKGMQIHGFCSLLLFLIVVLFFHSQISCLFLSVLFFICHLRPIQKSRLILWPGMKTNSNPTWNLNRASLFNPRNVFL